MAQKDLIIGAFSNYKEFQVLKPWVHSIKKSGFVGDIVLVAVDVEPKLVEELIAEGVLVLDMGKVANIMIHMLRFFYVYDYINNHKGKYRYVISTDVRDVIFQKNPIEWLEKHIQPGLTTKIIAASEAIKIKDESWNKNNIIKNYGQYFYDRIKDNDVCNVGILAGHADYVADLCFHIFQLSLNRADWVSDQAAYNLLLGTDIWNQTTFVAKLKDAWAANLHVTNKPDQLEQFGPYLLEGRPSLKDGLMCNAEGEPFYIVHQYDRVPEFMEFYSKKYGINITKDTDIGTSPKYIIQ